MDHQSSDLTEEERSKAIADLEAEALASTNLHIEYLDDEEYEDIEMFDVVDDLRDVDYVPNKRSKRVSAPSPSPSTSSSSSSKLKKKDREHAAKVAICQEVRKYPSLYQITHKEHLNKVAKDAIWEEISASLKGKIGPKMTIQHCRKLWEALRESTR